MKDTRTEDTALYNLEGGPRRLVVRDGKVKAVAPGLRLVDATEEEAKPLTEEEEARRVAKEKEEYGLPV